MLVREVNNEDIAKIYDWRKLQVKKLTKGIKEPMTVKPVNEIKGKGLVKNLLYFIDSSTFKSSGNKINIKKYAFDALFTTIREKHSVTFHSKINP